MNPASPASSADARAEIAALERRHLRFGWWCVLVFLAFGGLLEALHGFKVDLLLNVENQSRRHMWTLAHAHGTLLGLLNLAMAWSLSRMPAWRSGPRKLASSCLVAASLLIPGGFFLGGVVVHAGDPGIGVALVPPGALVLFVGVFLVAREATRD